MTSRPASSFVFLGPSLPLAEARRILDAVYLPPVSMGDVYRLMARGPRVIAIIDGLFERTPAVWHKEILFALSRGVRVLGASSMGALRAAELAAFGMEGVGEIFEAFHRGELEDDDEVAVAHAPAADGYRSLSDAMVNLRAGLREARDAGRISAAVARSPAAARRRRSTTPSDRGRSSSRLAAGLGIPDAELAALRAQIAQRRPDVKRADAIRLLERLAGEAAAGTLVPATPPAPPSFDFEPTYFWEQMILHEGEVGDERRRSTRRRERRRGREHRRAAAPPAPRSRARARCARRRVAALSRRRAGGAPGHPRPRRCRHAREPRRPPMRSRFRRTRAPTSRASSASIDALLGAVPDQVNRRLPAALAHLGRLQPTLVEVRRKQAILRSLGLRAAAPADAGLTPRGPPRLVPAPIRPDRRLGGGARPGCWASARSRSSWPRPSSSTWRSGPPARVKRSLKLRKNTEVVIAR